MQIVMKRLKGHFAIMVLVAKGKWLMAGCRDYPLAIGKDNRTGNEATDTKMLDLFSSKVLLISGKTKPAIFCATSFESSFQSEMILPVSL
jgi:glucosamine 6-phosphate synthetase-like amidotransferase/phosphosugar isomerase protein